MWLLFKLIVFLYFVPYLVHMFEQHDYILVFERMEVVSFNKQYMNLVKFHNFKYNRTQAVMNGTLDFKASFGNDMRGELQATKFVSNEYRLFPITFGFNMCDVLNRNEFGLQNFYDCGNFPRCPMTKGNFFVCNWSPDYSKFPPYIPHGRYRHDISFLYHTDEVFKLQVYCAIKPSGLFK